MGREGDAEAAAEDGVGRGFDRGISVDVAVGGRFDAVWRCFEAFIARSDAGMCADHREIHASDGVRGASEGLEVAPDAGIDASQALEVDPERVRSESHRVETPFVVVEVGLHRVASSPVGVERARRASGPGFVALTPL